MWGRTFKKLNWEVGVDSLQGAGLYDRGTSKIKFQELCKLNCGRGCFGIPFFGLTSQFYNGIYCILKIREDVVFK